MTEDNIMAEMWNEYHENVLRQWGEASACYRYMHHRAFLTYKKLSLRFSLPVIVLSTITGTANFAQRSFQKYKGWSTRSYWWYEPHSWSHRNNHAIPENQ